MLRRPLRNADRSLADERGFTLVELLVIMATGLVVFSALFAVLDVTLRQTNRIVSQVDATQQARTAMAKIEQELQSSCVGGFAAPIQEGSNGDSLIFISGSGSSATVVPVWNEITYTPNGTRGTLTHSQYATTGTASDPAPSTLLRTDTLLGRVSPDGSTPIFEYFAYETPSSGSTPYLDPSGNEYRMLLLDNQTELPSGATLDGSPAGGTVPANSPLALTSPLDDQSVASDPNRAAAVFITLNVYPDRGSDVDPDAFGAAGVVTDLAVMRLTPVANHAGDSQNVSPCA
jgi:type II secretory pathway pseudopilin PulG